VTTFLLPIEGLTITSPWDLGRVQLHPREHLRSLLGDEPELLLGHKLIGESATQVAEELQQGTIARVDADDIDAALDFLTLATDLLRVFQKIGARFRTTMFGLPGQLYRSHVRYLTVGESRGPGFRYRGEAVGCTFDDQTHTAWQGSRTFTSLAALVGADGPLEEGQRRALLGVQLLSQAVLEHRPAFKILSLVIALESMLLDRSSGPQTFRLLRRVTYFTCGRATGSLCGRGRPACQFLALDPGIEADLRQLKRLSKLAKMDRFWRCSEWFAYEHWYDLRSAVAHGDDKAVTVEDASQAEYWIFMWTVEPLLQWLVEHPVTPLVDLDSALEDLGPVPDWQDPVPDPNTYQPGSYQPRLP
jgi:hypothetical protein